MIRQNIIRIIGKSSFLKRKIWNLLEASYLGSYTKGGEGESEFLRIFSKFCEEPTVIDVGANIGKWSEKVKEIIPESKIYAIEPIPSFFSHISESAVKKKYNLALSDKCSLLKVYQAGGGAKPFKKNVKGKESIEHEIHSIPGDQFVTQNIPFAIDLIKIDTDGFDYEVILGLSQTIESHQPIVQFEVSHWWLKMGYTLTQAERFFKNLGYVCRVLTDNGLVNIGPTVPNYLFITANIVAIPENKLEKFT
ncbi:FkbM family methyltransferase [Vibrio profundum]|uniref:FkbM family methyltransferase n=1 Tax=Vibrio profundum TaxID=2910247 RepID=UPI003D0DE907